MASPQASHGSRTGVARTPRGTLSRQLIIDQATKVMDEEGVDAVTVRRLAKNLDVRPMALYTYFRSKDQILAAVYDTLLSGIELPDTADAGLDGVRQIARGYFRLLTEHAALVRVSTGNEFSNTSDLRISEAIYTLLLNAGIDRRDAVGLAATLTRFTIGCASLYPVRRSWDEDSDYWSRIKKSLQTLSEDRYPTLRSFGDDLPEFTQEQVFEFGLAAILDRFFD